MVKPFYQIQTLQTLVKFRFAQIKEIITKEFLLVHLMLFIPLSIATSFFVIFPFLFDNKLGVPEHSPIALFVNGLLTVSLQSYFSRKINLTIKQNAMGGANLGCWYYLALVYYVEIYFCGFRLYLFSHLHGD